MALQHPLKKLKVPAFLVVQLNAMKNRAQIISTLEKGFS